MDTGFEITVARDFEDLTEQASDLISQSITNQTRVRDRVTVVLSGGSTPRRLYERLARGDVVAKIPWGRVHLFWGDERCGPPEDPKSNYRMAYESLIRWIPIPPENIHRMPFDLPDPERAAEEYEASLRRFFGPSEGEWPRFDVVLLGVGPDGHTASLFPNSPVLGERKRWVAAVYVEKLKNHRLTLTVPVFNHAAQVIFLVAGKEKARVMKTLRPAEPKRVRFPYQLIRPHTGRLTFLLDREAAGSLQPS